MPKTKPKQPAHDRRVTAADDWKDKSLRYVIDIGRKAQQLESLLASDNPKGESVRDVLATLLVEISNETSTYYHEPAIARALYHAAKQKAETMPDLSWAGKTALRHLDLLLTTPYTKTAKALAKFWDVEGSYGPAHDPFPEHPPRKKRKP